MRSSVCMASYSWLGAVDSSTSLPEWRSTSSSGTDTSSSSQTFSRVLTGGTSYMYSLLNCIILRLVAILYPLKYHVYASCRAGKIICIITIFLTGLLTLLSNIFILSRTFVYSAFERFPRWRYSRSYWREGNGPFSVGIFKEVRNESNSPIHRPPG